MSGTPRSGRNSAIYVDSSLAANGSASPVSSKNKWGIDQSTDFLDVTAFGDDTQVQVPGLPKGSGTWSGFWDSADLNMYNLIETAIPRKFYVYPDRSNNVGTYFYCTAYFTLSHEAGVNDAVTMTGGWTAATSVKWVRA